MTVELRLTVLSRKNWPRIHFRARPKVPGEPFGPEVCPTMMQEPSAVHALTDVHETPLSAPNVSPGGSGTVCEATLALPSKPFQTAASGYRSRRRSGRPSRTSS